ncbi:MAG: hypothetical protein IAE98_13355 [Candidatus Kapabacteria bacterium]|nr:hypothetical protein [Candidatus Kapabacteria bacterium]
MEIFIAILWYFHILVSGVTYTTTEVEQIIQINQPIIQSVQQDPVLENQILELYEGQIDIVEPDNDLEPIRN